MRRILFWAAVTMIAAVSCDKFGDDALTLESGADAFIASVEGTDTKTVIDGFKSYWNGKEEIWVLNGANSGDWKKKYTATATKEQRVIFKPEKTDQLTGDDYLAVYPAEPANSVKWSGNISSAATNFWLKGEQVATEGSYDPAAHIAIAYTEKGNNFLEFKNVNALIKVVIPYDNITEVCFYGNNKEKITGNFDVRYNDHDPKATGATQDFAKITGALKKGTTYYISILPTTFTNGFTLEFVMDGVKYIKRNNGEYTVHRNQIIDLPSVEYTAFSPQSGQVYLIPNDDWKSNAARFAAYFYDTAGNEKWVNMTRVPNTYIYECKVPTDKDYLGVIFCRMNPSSTSNGWTQNTQLWNKSGDQLLCIGNQFEITGWDTGTWKGNPIYSDYLFLKPNTNWVSGNARFAAYFFGNGDVWVNMKDVNLDNFYEVRKPTSKNYPKVIFCRMNPEGTNGWTQDSQKWNQTSDLTIPGSTSNLYTINEGAWDKGGGSWTKMTF